MEQEAERDQGGVPSKGMRHWGRMRKGHKTGLMRQGIPQGRHAEARQERGKCRGCHGVQ